MGSPCVKQTVINVGNDMCMGQEKPSHLGNMGIWEEWCLRKNSLLHWCLRPKPLPCVSFATAKECWDGGSPCCSSHSVSRGAIHRDVSGWSGKWQCFSAGCLSQGGCCPDDYESSETSVATGQERWWNTTLTTRTPLVMMVSGGPELGNRKKNAFTIAH